MKLEIGIDEVGKGCIFGPVFSAIVVIEKKNISVLRNLGIDDSKKLSKKKREQLIPYIFNFLEDWGLGQSSVREIDTLGIRYATEISMIRAIDKLKCKPSKILVDGSLPIRSWEGHQETVIKGDNKFISIAAASIIAKVKRDNLIHRISKKYKEYSLSTNNGYGTKKHFYYIDQHGITNLHRKTFLKNLNVI